MTDRIVPLIPSVRGMVHRRFALADHQSREDLVQAGMEGVCQADKRYRPGKGTSFRTFALLRAHGAMQDQLRHDQPGTRAHPLPPHRSMDKVEPEESGGFTLHDVLAAPQEVGVERVLDAIDTLPPDLQRSVRLYGEADLKMQTVADMEGLTIGRIHQKVGRARNLLRKEGFNDRRSKQRS